MAYLGSITDILNNWADLGVFAYLLPGLMIFAVIYGILSRLKMLGDNKGVNVVVAFAVALMALQFDYVSNFFATIFPYAGIGISVLLVAMILMGLIADEEKVARWVFFGIGALIFIVVILYTISDYSWLGGYSGQDYWPAIVLVLVIGGAVVAMLLGDKRRGSQQGTHH